MHAPDEMIARLAVALIQMPESQEG